MAEDIHVFLDEKYADPKKPCHLQLTLLAGSYFLSDQLIKFRQKFFVLMRQLFPDPRPNHVPQLVPVHASDLFKDRKEADDNTRLFFLKELISIVNDLQIFTYCCGYWRNARIQELFLEFKKHNDYPNYPEFEKKFLRGACFLGFQPPKGDPELKDGLLFFHIERDNTDFQYQLFQNNIQTNQWFSSILGPENMSVNLDLVADVSFYNKGSFPGVVPDFMAYLSYLKWQQNRGESLGEYKSKMVSIFNSLDPDLIHTQFISMGKISK